MFYGATHLCVFDGGALASLHLFGSAATGPYTNGEANSPEDPHTDTELRICEVCSSLPKSYITRHAFAPFLPPSALLLGAPRLGFAQ